MELKLQSMKRPIIEAELGGRKVMLLADTGASVGMLDIGLKKVLHISQRRLNIVDASGDEIGCPIVNDLVKVGGKAVGQFICSDLCGIRGSIRRETGLGIDGILGYPQMQMLGMVIDTVRNTVRIN